MGDPVSTVKLAHPIDLGDEVVSELRFRRLKAKDLRQAEVYPGKQLALLLDMAGRLSGQPPSVIDELEGEDLQSVIEVVSGFFGDGQETGGMLSGL